MRTDLMNIEDAVDGHEGSKHDQSKPTEAEEAERLGAAFGAIAGLVVEAQGEAQPVELPGAAS
jgi:hypothetical protein